MLDRVLVFAHFGAFGLVVAAAIAVARRRGRAAAGALGGIALATATCCLVFAWLTPHRIPIEWISVLQEGRTELEVNSVLGVGAHAGPAFHALVEAVAPIAGERLRGIVRLNVALAAGNLVLFAFVARGALGWSARALLTTLLFGACGTNVQSALSEVPSQIVGTHFLLATLLVQTAGRLRHERAVGLHLAAATGALGALATLTRIELGAISVPATIVLALEATGRGAWLEKIPSLARALVARVRAMPPTHRRALFVALGAFYLTFPLYLSVFGWTLEVFHPIWLLTLVAFPDYLAQWMGWGVVVLFLLGLTASAIPARRALRRLALPWTLAYVLALYAHAANAQFYEVFRYCSALGAPIFFVALRGWDVMDRLADRVMSPRFARRLVTVVVGLSAIAPSAGQRELFRGERPWTETRLGQIIELSNNPPWFRAPVQRDHQVSTRHLLRAVESHPDCVFVTRVWKESYGATVEADWSYLFFGARMKGARTRKLPAGNLTVEQAVAAQVPDSACVIFYRGLDCNLTFADGCERDLAGRKAIETSTIAAAPFCDPAEYGVVTPLLRLGLYEVDGHPTGANPTPGAGE